MAELWPLLHVSRLSPDYTNYKATPQTEQMVERLMSIFHLSRAQRGQDSRYELLRSEARRLAQIIVSYTPPSREQSLALTNLERAIFLGQCQYCPE